MCNWKLYLPDLEIGVTDFEGADDLSSEPRALFTESITKWKMIVVLYYNEFIKNKDTEINHFQALPTH